MNLLDANTVRKLVDEVSKPAVTIYIPIVMGASPPNLSENQLRVKNLIHDAVKQLETNEEGADLAKELTEFHEQLTGNQSFWEAKYPGILICATSGSIEYFALPIDTEEYVAIDEAFHLAPILALMEDEREFYVLSLAQQNPALYKGNIYGLEPAGIELPHDAGEALGIDEPNQKSENQGSATGSSMNTGWFNGRGGARNPQDQDRIRFFRILNKVVLEKLNRNTPLILAGVESDVAEFRMLSEHPTILEGTIAGNHNHEKPEALFGEAMVIIRNELIEPAHQRVVDSYVELHGANPDKTSVGEKAVEKAAVDGRVDQLIAAMSRQTTDTVQTGYDSVLRITFPEGQHGKKLNSLASMVYKMSGKIYSLKPEQMPEGTSLVAMLRY